MPTSSPSAPSPFVAPALKAEPAPSIARPRADPPPAAPEPQTARAVSAWLAENGLAWLGGGALALGGLLLVVAAAQRGMFTPPLRIVAALVLGAVMVAAGEWIRRQKHAPGGRHMLAASVAAGAGATTIYGAIWAAHALYDLIPLEAAAALIAIESLALLAYAFLHGQPIAILALAGGFLAPAVTGPRDWSPIALQSYLGALVVTGLAVAALRSWRGAGLVTLAGAFLWALSGWGVGDHAQAIVLTVGPVILTALAEEWRRRQPTRDDEPTSDLPAVALGAASALALFGWLRFAFESAPFWQPAPVVASGLLIVLAAMLVWRRLAPAAMFAAPVIVAALGGWIALYLAPLPTRDAVIAAATRDAILAPLMFGLAAVAAIGGLLVALSRQVRDRTLLLAMGGLGAALIATLTWPALHALPLDRHWLAPGGLALMFAAGAWLLARRSDDTRADMGLALWIAGGAELIFLSVYGAIDPFYASIGQGAAALLLAGLATRLPWRGLAQTAVAGGLVAFASLLRWDVVREALATTTEPATLALVTGLTAALVFAAGRLLPLRADVRNEAEALDVAALVIALFGAFLLIDRGMTQDRADIFGPLMATSLRSLLLLAATLLLSWRARPDDGPLARWRLPVLLVIGLGYSILGQALVVNPWWGFGEAPAGPPVANTLVLSFLAPALLLAAIAGRGVQGASRWSRVAAVGAFLFAWLWVLMALRHGFHPQDMAGAVGRAEAASYALLGLATAAALRELRGRAGEGSRLSWLGAAAQSGAWAGLAFSALVFWLWANPWWGPIRTALPPADAALLFALYATGAGATFALARRADRQEGWRALAQAARVVVAVDVLVLALLLVRYAFHGAVLGGVTGRAELAAFALVGLATGLILILLRRTGDSERPAWLAMAAQPVSWGAIAASALVFWLWASPWWGPLRTPLAPAAGAALLFAGYAAGAGASLEIARRADRAGWSALARAALSAAVIDLFILVTLLVRYGFRGPEMAERLVEARIETWAFSAVWALFGLAVLVIGAARRSLTLRWLGLALLIGTVAKVLLFDTARLDGVIRAASFLAVGALLIIGAVAARRLNAGAFFAPRKTKPEPEAA